MADESEDALSIPSDLHAIRQAIDVMVPTATTAATGIGNVDADLKVLNTDLGKIDADLKAINTSLEGITTQLKNLITLLQGGNVVGITIQPGPPTTGK